MSKLATLEELLQAQELAISGVLFAPSSFKAATTEQLKKHCNGCGAEGSRLRPPKRMWGTLIVFACIIHDWMYSHGLTNEDKEEADRIFKHNMNRLVTKDRHKWYKPTALQRVRVFVYFKTVDWFGGEAFWAGKN